MFEGFKVVQRNNMFGDLGIMELYHLDFGESIVLRMLVSFKLFAREV